MAECDDESTTIDASSHSTFHRSSSDSLASYNLESFISGVVDIDEPDQSFDYVFEEIYGPIDKPELHVSNLPTLMDKSKEYDELDGDSDSEEEQQDEDCKEQPNKTHQQQRRTTNISVKKEIFLEKMELRARFQRLKLRTSMLAQTPKEFIDTVTNRRKSGPVFKALPPEVNHHHHQAEPSFSATEPSSSTEGSSSSQQSSDEIVDDSLVMVVQETPQQPTPVKSGRYARCDSSLCGSSIYIEGRDDDEEEETVQEQPTETVVVTATADQPVVVSKTAPPMELVQMMKTVITVSQDASANSNDDNLPFKSTFELKTVDTEHLSEAAKEEGTNKTETDSSSSSDSEQAPAPPPPPIVETKSIDSFAEATTSNIHLREFTRVPRRLETETERLLI